MPIRKRSNGVYFIDLRAPDGSRIRRSSGTCDRKAAQEYHDKLKHELWRVAKLGEKPKHSFDDAALRFLKEYADSPDAVNKKIHIRHFRAHFAGRTLDSITRDDVFNALPEFSQKSKGEPVRVTATTKNLYLSTIRSMLNRAVREWEWIGSAPTLSNLPTRNRRIRWITREEAKRLFDAISTDWMRDVTILGFATGLRQANLLHLEWSQVDLVKRRAWIHPDQAKARKPIGVPLNTEAVEVIRRQLGRHNRFVFSRKGKPIVNWDIGQWNRAVERAGIEHFRFHDVRHTWASWHVQSGTPLNQLMELGGWAKYEHVLRYAHLAPDHLAHRAEAVMIWSTNQDSSEAGNPQSLVA